MWLAMRWHVEIGTLRDITEILPTACGCCDLVRGWSMPARLPWHSLELVVSSGWYAPSAMWAA